MDEMVRPLRIPPLMSVYADQHDISQLLQTMVSSLLVDVPDDPLSYLISLLQRTTVDVPRVMVLGPPVVGKHTVATRLSSELRAVHVTLHRLLEDQSEQSTHSQQELPNELLVQLIQQRLKEEDCFNRGWVVEGVPQSHLQAVSLQQVGVMPQHVVMLDAPDDVLLARSRGRLVDPLTGDTYHQMFIPPADDTVAQRLEKGQNLRPADLQEFRREVRRLSSTYGPMMKVINADQPHLDVYQQVLSFVQIKPRSLRTPRILLLGPPGSGKSLQARLLSERFKMVDVCCGHLLRSVSADGSSLGEEIRSYLDDGCPVPDSVVLKVLEDHLSRVDCSCRGWVLHGFPRDVEQGRSLQESQHRPNRVFFLDLTDDVCVERISLRTIDPITGHRYHFVTCPPPPISEIQNRLKTRPEDKLDAVTQRLDQYKTRTVALQCVFPDAVHVDADQDPLRVFEVLQSRLTSDQPVR
ncbi:adenylate kinase 8 [Pholidichthys leucotaenia]